MKSHLGTVLTRHNLASKQTTKTNPKFTLCLLGVYFLKILVCSWSALGPTWGQPLRSALRTEVWSRFFFFLTSCKPCSLNMESCLISLRSEIQSQLLKLTSSFYVRSGSALGKPGVSSESAIADPTLTHSRHGTQTWDFIGVCFLLGWSGW